MKRIWKFILADFALLAIFARSAVACSLCRAQVKSDIYDRNFLVNLLMMLLPIVIITAMGFGLYHADKILEKLRGGIK